MMLRKLLLGLCCLSPALNALAAPELYFSEYIEGSSNNKALEIANTTGADIDLSSYEVQIYFNGNSTAGLTIALSGTVENNNVFVLANANANTDILNVTDQTNGAGWFNGDDAIALLNGGAIVDVIGQIGVDPGSQWGNGDTSTQNNTLRRIEPVASGDSNGSDIFDPAVEWEGFPQNSVEDLGMFMGESDNGGNNGDGNNASLVISEIDADNTGTDSLEFIELFDGGQGLTSLDGLVLVLFNGSDDASYDAIDLDGYSTNSEGYFVIGSAGVANVDLVEFTTNGLQNGADAVALIVGDAADFPNDTPVTTAHIIDVVVYDTNDSDDSGLLSGLGVSEQINEGGSGDKDNHSNQRCETNAFIQSVPTPGVANACVPVVTIGQCSDPATLISAIQGEGAISPLATTQVEVEAIVVGDFQNNNQLRGFYLQEESADQDSSAASSEGLFVFAGTTLGDVAVGDRVRVAGTVSEFFGLTQVSDVSALQVCATGVPVAATSVSFPVASTEQLESLEGMLITLPQTMVATENYNLGRYHEVVLASERLYQPTHLTAPGAAALAIQAANDLKRVILDDASTAQNPSTVTYPAPQLSAFNTLRGGDTVAGLTGIMSYGFGAYRIQPTIAPEFTAANLRSSEPTLASEGNLTVASFNVLNYFNGNGQGGGFPTPRGADTADEFERQRAKIINALLAIDADIVGLVEIENDGYGANSAIQDLVNGLNDSGASYAAVDPGVPQIGSDAIAVGFIYKTNRVETINAAAILDTSVDSRFIDTKNRPALAQTFRLVDAEGVLTLAVNHFKSKGSACDDVNDPNQNDGQGNCNLTRTMAADALADWLATDPTNSSDGDVMILGDLNAYAKEDPITALTSKDYINLIEAKLGEQAYSYVFNGQFGYLDYALANNALRPQVVDVTEWHINSDEPRVLDYNQEFKSAAQIVDWYSPEPYRASDHDPVIVRLNLTASLVGDFDFNGVLDAEDRYWLNQAIADYANNGVYDATFDLNNDQQLNEKDINRWEVLNN